jgi:single-strand DNA-binding protein
MNFNKVIIGGNLARDPEVRYTPKGTVVASFALAINHSWKNDAGEKKEEVTFVEVTAFGKQAEVIQQYFRKGKPMLIEGRLRQESWEDKESGKKRTAMKVVLESFSFAGGNRDEVPAATPGKPAGPKAPAPPEDLEKDEVPF